MKSTIQFIKKLVISMFSGVIGRAKRPTDSTITITGNKKTKIKGVNIKASAEKGVCIKRNKESEIENVSIK